MARVLRLVAAAFTATLALLAAGAFAAAPPLSLSKRCGKPAGMGERGKLTTLSEAFGNSGGDRFFTELLAQVQFAGIQQLRAAGLIRRTFHQDGAEEKILPRIENQDNLTPGIALRFHFNHREAPGVVKSLHALTYLIFIQRLVGFLHQQGLQPRGILNGCTANMDLGDRKSLQVVEAGQGTLRRFR